MQGDFSRDSFDPTNHFLRVLMQQGRVQVDADWNEQTAILLHYMQSLAKAIIGSHGGPNNSFSLSSIRNQNHDFLISAGSYYVDGLLCENDHQNGLAYTKQSDYPYNEEIALGNGRRLIYLDVWERHITHVQDRTIREVALGPGVDTATRSKLIWQVKAEPLPEDINCGNLDRGNDGQASYWQQRVNLWQPTQRGELKARAMVTAEIDATDPCVLPPDSRYRRTENQLYRVEIHHVAANGDAYFKWSRENGAVIFPIASTAGETVTVLHLGMDSRFALKEDDWVELVDDMSTLHGKTQELYQIKQIDSVNLKVTLDRAPSNAIGQDAKYHPLLRRWDHQERAGGPETDSKGILITEGTGDKGWIALEDGIQVQFQPGATYRPGDYWLIPARTAIGDVLWPLDDNGTPQAVTPHGIMHHYAPLGILDINNDGGVNVVGDCRCRLLSLCELSEEYRNRRDQ